MPDIWHLSNPTELYNTKSDVYPNVNCGLELMIMCHCWSISCNKCTILMPDVNNRKSCMRGERGYLGTSCIFLET